MRILHVAEASYAGVGRHLVDLARHQVERGHTVTVAYGTRRESTAFRRERGHLSGIDWVPMRAGRRPGWSDVTALRSVGRLAARLRPDIVHGHSTKGGLVARLLPVRRRTWQVVYTPHAIYSLNPDLGSLRRAAVDRAEQTLARWTDAIIAVSPEEAAHLGRLGIDPTRIHLVPNGVPPLEPADRADVCAALGLDPDRLIIGFVGRLAAQKAPDDLLEVFRLVARARPEADLLVVGDGPLAGEVERKIESSPELVGRVHLVGEQPGPWAMSAMDLLVLPSRYEGLSYVLLEASQMGLPLVVTSAANSTLLLETASAIRERPVGDIDGLAAACLELLDRPEAPASGGGPRRFTVESMAAQTEQVYRGVRTVRSLPLQRQPSADPSAASSTSTVIDLDQHRPTVER